LEITGHLAHRMALQNVRCTIFRVRILFFDRKNGKLYLFVFSKVNWHFVRVNVYGRFIRQNATRGERRQEGFNVPGLTGLVVRTKTKKTTTFKTAKSRTSTVTRTPDSYAIRTSTIFLSTVPMPVQTFSRWSRTTRRTTATSWSSTPRNPCRCSARRCRVRRSSGCRNSSENFSSSKVSARPVFLSRFRRIKTTAKRSISERPATRKRVGRRQIILRRPVFGPVLNPVGPSKRRWVNFFADSGRATSRQARRPLCVPKIRRVTNSPKTRARVKGIHYNCSNARRLRSRVLLTSSASPDYHNTHVKTTKTNKKYTSLTSSALG